MSIKSSVLPENKIPSKSMRYYLASLSSNQQVILKIMLFKTREQTHTASVNITDTGFLETIRNMY